MLNVKRMLRSYDQAVAARGVKSLRSLPIDEAIAIVEQLSVEADPEFRCCALDAMASICQNRAEQLAIRLVADPHEAVRDYACNVLGELQSSNAVPISKLLATTDPEDMVRDQAVYWLGELGDASVLPVLEAIIERDEGVDHEGTPIREHAVKAIQKVKDRVGKRSYQ